MATFSEDNFPSVFPHAVAEDWREVDGARAAERFIHVVLLMQLLEQEGPKRIIRKKIATDRRRRRFFLYFLYFLGSTTIQ